MLPDKRGGRRLGRPPDYRSELILEDEFHRPLNDARRHTASAGGIEGRGQLPEGSGIRRQARSGEVRVVEDVERFQSGLEM